MPLTDKYFFSYLIFFNLTFLCKFKVQSYYKKVKCGKI